MEGLRGSESASMEGLRGSERMSFGGFQTSQENKERILPKRMTVRNRYNCLVCGETLKSDEALQLHRTWHAVVTLNSILADGFDMLGKKLEA